MIDALGHVARMEGIPMRGFVGIDGAAECDAIMQAAHAIGFAIGHEGQCLAVAGNDHDLALARLVLRKATVATVLFVIGRLDVAARIHAVDLDVTGNLLALVSGTHRLAQLVRQHEGRLVLAVEITGELERSVALCAVHEDGDGGQQIPNGHLTAVKDRAGRDRELSVARLALEDATGLELVDHHAAARGAEWLAIRVGPANRLERLVSLAAIGAKDLRLDLS